MKRIGEKEWTDEVQGAWDKLKAVLKKAPVLSAPDYSLPFRVATDASQYGIGAVLYQVKEGKNHYICGWRGYEREEKEGEREVDNLSTCGCVIQLYLWENTRFIEIREFGWGFLMLTS